MIVMKRIRKNWSWEDTDSAKALADWVGFPDARSTSQEGEMIEGESEGWDP